MKFDLGSTFVTPTDIERATALLDALVKIRREADTGRVAYGVVALNEIIRIADDALNTQLGNQEHEAIREVLYSRVENTMISAEEYK